MTETILNTTFPNPLDHDELLRLMALIDGCSNRFGQFDTQAGGRAIRKRILDVVEKPSPASWRAVKLAYIAWKPERMSFGLAAETYSGFDPSAEAHPTRDQLLTTLRAVAG